MVDCLERADVTWCVIGGVAVNHWAREPMVTQDVDFVVAVDSVERTIELLNEAGFQSETFHWSVNFKGRSKVSLQLSTEDFYQEFPSHRFRPMYTAFSCESPRLKTHCEAK